MRNILLLLVVMLGTSLTISIGLRTVVVGQEHPFHQKKDDEMAVWGGYHEIVHFEELRSGQRFASTRTGKHYIKSGDVSFHPDQEDDGRPEDVPVDDAFGPRTLVYVGPIVPEGWL